MIDGLRHDPALRAELERRAPELGLDRGRETPVKMLERQIEKQRARERQIDRGKSHVMADEQRRRLWRAGLAGLAARIVLWAVVAGPNRPHPAGELGAARADGRAIPRMPMWEGGQRLMKAGDSQAFAGVLAGNRLAVANGTCRRQAAKAGKAVRCAIEIGTGE